MNDYSKLLGAIFVGGVIWSLALSIFLFGFH